MDVVALTRDEMLVAVGDLITTVMGRGADWGRFWSELFVLRIAMVEGHDDRVIRHAREIGRLAETAVRDAVGASQALGPGCRPADPTDPLVIGLTALPDAVRAMLDREQAS